MKKIAYLLIGSLICLGVVFGTEYQIEVTPAEAGRLAHTDYIPQSTSPTNSTEGKQIVGLVQFLKEDLTDLNLYVNVTPDCFMCGQFAESLIENATKYDIQLYPVDLTRIDKKVGHIMVVMDVEGEWLFVDPHYDSIYYGKYIESDLATVYSNYKIGTDMLHISCYHDTPDYFNCTDPNVKAMCYGSEVINIIDQKVL